MGKADWLALAAAQFKGGGAESTTKTYKTPTTPAAQHQVLEVSEVLEVVSDGPPLFKAEPTVAAAANQWRIFSRDGSCRVITFAPARTEAQVRDDYPACAALVEIASTEPACALCQHATRYGNCAEPIAAGLADRFCLVAHPSGGTGCKHFASTDCSHQ
jgi:hypothetical protein